jgi:hypothetical protein
MNLRFWMTHPRQLVTRLRYYAWERLNPNKPWLCPGTVDFCERHLTCAMTGLEFGSGRSTAWFASKVGNLTSVENNRDWFLKIQKRLATTGANNVDYRFAALDHAMAEAEAAPDQPTPAYVRVAEEFPDHSLDFVLVDGHYRDHCIRRAVRKLRAGGYLIVDDVNFWPRFDRIPVPAGWPVVDDSSNGLKRCVIWKAA